MYRAWIFLALWAASPISAQVGSTGLYTEFQHPPVAAVFQAIRDEVSNLLAPGGLHFQWRMLPLIVPETWTELAIVTFDGHCEVLPFASNSHLDHRLGWTEVSVGQVLPFATVDCDAVRADVLDQLVTLPPESRDRIFGRAVGRVTAHELLHIFAKTTHHSAHGVDQASLSRDELLADRMILENHESGSQILRIGRHPVVKSSIPSAQSGRTSYTRQGCAACHGEEGQGTRHGPVLRVAGRLLNSVILAAKLTKSQAKMCQRARSLKVEQPTLTEDELDDVAWFLSEVGR